MSNESPPVKRELNIWLPLLFSLVLVAGMFIGTKMQDNPPKVASIDVSNETLPPGGMGQGKLEELIRYIESRYVDDVNKDELVKEAIDNILYQFDPHSNYISAEQLRSVNDQLEGNFDGIGIEFLVVDDTVMIIAALPDGPAKKAGILPGDKIVEIEDSLTVGKNIEFDGILDKLKGDLNSKIKIGVRRGNEPGIRHFTLSRDKIPVHSVEVAYMLDDKTGYFKLERFSANTYEEFMRALEDLVDNHGLKNIVIDLRQNGGGYLQEATNILSQLFEEKDKLLVYTEGNNVPRSEYKSNGRNFYDIENVSILVDEGSASASEILAGAIQDWDRGVIIGRRTFGKGLVQEQYGLRDGSAIRLTVARYYTPSGRCIQKPYDAGRNEYDHDVADRIQNGELYDGGKIVPQDTTKYFTGAGRVVFGGGGIAPDVFIPMDSNQLKPDFLRAVQHIPAFVFRYLEKKRTELEAAKMDDFIADFQVSNEMLDSFYKFVRSKEKKSIPAFSQSLETEIRLRIKAILARQLWSEAGFSRVMNQGDPAVQTAIKLMREEKPLAKSGALGMRNNK